MNDFENVWAPGGPGSTVKATVAAGATSTAVQIRTAPTAGGFVVNQAPLFVTITAASTAAGPGYHVVFGDVSVGAPTAADFVLQDADGWVRVQLPANVTHFRIFGEGATAGSVYLYISGKQN